MKKCLALLLTGAMTLSLAACGGAKSPKVIYDEATKKTQELSSMEATSVVSMQMTQGEQNMDIKMDLDMKIADINTDSMKYLAQGKANTSVMGQNVDMDLSMYYENGYYYTEVMDQKIKYAMDMDAMVKQIKDSTGGAGMDSSYMKEITAKKDGDNQILTFTVDGEKMNSYVQDMMSQMSSGMGTNLEGVTYDIKEVSGEATVNKDGYFSNVKMKMTMDMTMEGETVAMTIDMDCTYNNPGQTVEVTAPDLEGYTEIDANAVQNQ